MNHEAGQDIQSDQFFIEGMQLMQEEARKRAQRKEREEEHAAQAERLREESREIELLEGKLKREELKKDLFAYLDD